MDGRQRPPPQQGLQQGYNALRRTGLHMDTACMKGTRERKETSRSNGSTGMDRMGRMGRMMGGEGVLLVLPLPKKQPATTTMRLQSLSR